MSNVIYLQDVREERAFMAQTRNNARVCTDTAARAMLARIDWELQQGPDPQRRAQLVASLAILTALCGGAYAGMTISLAPSEYDPA